jgi:hypothetical protein
MARLQLTWWTNVCYMLFAGFMCDTAVPATSCYCTPSAPVYYHSTQLPSSSEPFKTAGCLKRLLSILETTWCTPIGVMTETVALATLAVQVLWRPAHNPYAGCQP